ncbi:hypothetical protein IWX90DRAFT_419871 [Phyllosticta citrichinensis]|uniref:Uncharacterized protein n=1 Tax=Phyllosticta citrichinensis TaxID=1130410 RepID=A0ABR1Y5P2_9PEZI
MMRSLLLASATMAAVVLAEDYKQISFPFPAVEGDDVADYLGSVIGIQQSLTTLKVECKDSISTGTKSWADIDTTDICYFTDPVTMTVGPSTFAYTTELTGDGGTVDLTVSVGCSRGSSLVCAVSEGGPGAWANVCYSSYVAGVTGVAFSSCLTANSGTVPITTTAFDLKDMSSMTITVTDGGQSLTAGASVVAATATATDVSKNATAKATGTTTHSGSSSHTGSSSATGTGAAPKVTAGVALANLAGLVVAGLL